MNIENFYYELMQQDKYFENFNENPKSTDLALNSWPAQLWLPHVRLPYKLLWLKPQVRTETQI